MFFVLRLIQAIFLRSIMTTSVRLPDRVEQLLSAYCVETQRSKSEVIVELLEQRLSTVNVEASPYQRALEAGFIGCIETTDAEAGDIKSRVRAAILAKYARS
jgi:predicted transcriptional regulator